MQQLWIPGRPSRPVAVLEIVLAHGAVLVLLSRVHPSRPVTREDNSPLLLWFLPAHEEVESQHQKNSGAGNLRSATAAHNRRTPPALPAKPSAAAAAVLAPDVPERQPDSTAIDWHDEAAQAAATTLRARERTQRQAHALDQPPGMDEGHGIGVIPFRWNSWRAHRLELLPGALLFHINERCAVAIIPFPLPACVLGKIPIHGDLFERRKEERAQPTPALP